MRYRLMLVFAVVGAITRVSSNAQESSSLAQTPSSVPEITAAPEATAQPHPTWFSPDKKWEYRSSDDNAKIVKARTDQVASDFSDESYFGCDEAALSWAPDSKRFALNYGRGRNHLTALYQLVGDQWKALKSPEDEALQRADDIIAGQLKSQGLSEKKLEKQGKYLRLIWWTVKVDRWLDSNTAIVYASLQQVAARRDAPGEMDDGYGSDLLFTLRFDDAGKWKIVKTHRMSEKEVEQKTKEE
jgi:hypothetical protein